MKAEKRGFRNLSQEYIVYALLELMEKKPYNDISITEITQRAKIARRTFYLNFTSKQEVLNTYFDVLFLDFMEALNDYSYSDLYEKARAYFKFWEEKISLILLLEKNQLFELLIKKYSEKLSDQNFFNSSRDLGQSFSERELEIVILFNAAGLWKMLEYWAMTGQRESAEEMAKIFYKIVRNE